jgi:ankyrin repeat protein
LHLAADDGNITEVKQLLKDGADVDIRSSNNETPLHFAAYRGHLEIAKVLVSHGADINAVEESNFSPLHDAVEEGHVEITDFLLTQGADINIKNNNNRTAMHIAYSKDYLYIFSLLIKGIPKERMNEIKKEAALDEAKDDAVNIQIIIGVIMMMLALVCFLYPIFHHLTEGYPFPFDSEEYGRSLTRSLRRYFGGGVILTVIGSWLFNAGLKKRKRISRYKSKAKKTSKDDDSLLKTNFD